MWLALALACSTPSPPAEAAPPSTPAPDARSAPTRVTETLKTRDGVALEADLVLGKPGAHGVILLHMIPPHWTRASWPTAFVDALAGKGWSVCVVDRRGAGASRGVAKEAYEGEKGRYDVEACARRLSEHGLDELAVIGASNGTTSALDYALWDEAAPKPALLGFMTGGKYTENQHPVAEARDIPAVFTYSVAERAWSAAQEGISDRWTFHEYEGGEHGTKMFTAKPEVTADLLAALEGVLK